MIGHEENHDAKEESVNDDEEGDESRAVVIIAIENVDVWSRFSGETKSNTNRIKQTKLRTRNVPAFFVRRSVC